MVTGRGPAAPHPPGASGAKNIVPDRRRSGTKMAWQRLICVVPDIRGGASMPAKEKTLNDLFLEALKDVYHAEKQILRALPKMAKAAESEELREAFKTHREETQVQVERLEEVFEIIGKPARAKTCQAIQGIIEEGKEVMEDFADSEAIDAGLIAAAQAVEHYEISRYGTLKTWATQLGLRDAAKLLDQTLEEEKKTDKLLTGLAESALNQKAA
jgi:ferritin-like metal-binding protein YciE